MSLSVSKVIVHLLVDKVGQEDGGRHADGSVAAAHGALELHDQARDQQRADVWQLGVDDGDQRCKDGRVGRGGDLGAHEPSAEQAPAPYEVLHPAHASSETV